MGWNVALTERALQDLEQVVAFLARKSPSAAERLGLKLVETVFALDQMPYRGKPLRGRPGYRRVLHPPRYLVFYRLDEAQRAVEVVRIWDARQDPQHLAIP